MKRMAWGLVLGLLGTSVAAAQQQPFPPFEVDQQKVDKAIEAGIKYLKGRNADHLKKFAHVNISMSHRERST